MNNRERLRQFAPYRPYDVLKVDGKAVLLKDLIEQGRIEFEKVKNGRPAARYFARLKGTTHRWEISGYTYRAYGGE